MRKVSFLILLFFNLAAARSQVVFIPSGSMPEHGFLPGKKFKFYPAINTYDFKQYDLRVELFDDRNQLKLDKTGCSDLEFTNTSEFAGPESIYKISQYIDTLFKAAGARINPASKDTLRVRLEGIDSRLIGFGYIRVHGLCQIKVDYQTLHKVYCVDITDADKNSPVSSNALVTRKTATRIMASAAIRDVIEQFFADLKNYK